MACLPRPCSLPAFPRSLVKPPLPSLTAIVMPLPSLTVLFPVRGQYENPNFDYRNGDIFTWKERYSNFPRPAGRSYCSGSVTQFDGFGPMGDD